jgi:hypothetical protein
VCRIEVTILVPGGSAARSRLVQVGDCLQSIDGVIIRSVPQAKSLIVGDIGTTVTLMLLKKVPNPNVWNVFAPRERVESVSLQREVIQVMYCIQQLAVCEITLLQSLSYISDLLYKLFSHSYLKHPSDTYLKWHGTRQYPSHSLSTWTSNL